MRRTASSTARPSSSATRDSSSPSPAPTTGGPHPPSVYGFSGSAGPRPQNSPSLAGRRDAATARPAIPSHRSRTTPSSDAAAALLTIKQTTTYVNGANEFDVRWDVDEQLECGAEVQGAERRRLLLRGLRPRHGHLHPGPAALRRWHERRHRPLGRLRGGDGQLARWGPLSGVQLPGHLGRRNRAGGHHANPAFADSVEGEPTTTPAASSGTTSSTTGLAVGATTTYEVVIRNAVPAALQFNTTNAGSPQHVPVSFVATAKDTSGVAFAGKQLRYSITGVERDDLGRGDRRQRQRRHHRSRHQRRRRHGDRVRRPTTTASARTTSRRRPRSPRSSTTSRRRAP